MSKVNLNVLLAALPSLSKSDLKVIQAAVNNQLKMFGDNYNVADEQLLHKAFKQCMDQANLPFPKYGTFRKSPATVSYKENVAIVSNFIDTRFSGLTQPQRFKLMLLFSRCVMNYIQERMANDRDSLLLDALGFSLVCGKIPTLVERAYPGYIETGMLKAVLERYNNGHDKRGSIRHYPDVVSSYEDK